MHGTDVKITLSYVAVFLTLLYVLPQSVAHTVVMLFMLPCVTIQYMRRALCVNGVFYASHCFGLPFVVIHIMLHYRLIYASQYNDTSANEDNSFRNHIR